MKKEDQKGFPQGSDRALQNKQNLDSGVMILSPVWGRGDRPSPIRSTLQPSPSGTAWKP